VFDTSLENEYAVIAASLDQAREDGNRKYTSNSIYLYLENVRKMGLDQIFLLPRPLLAAVGTRAAVGVSAQI